MFDVALLGVKGGPAIAPGSNMPTSNVVRVGDRVILVDAGLGATQGVCKQGVHPREVDTILITHLHSDHYLELGPFLHTAWVGGLTRPVRVIGPRGLGAYWDGFLVSMAFDIDLRIEDEGRCDLRGLARIEELSEGCVLDEDGLRIDALRNHHPPIDESYALRFEAEGKRAVLSGDTAYFEPLIEFAKGADLLVHEALLESGVDALCAALDLTDGRLKRHLMQSHSAAQEAGRIASMAGVGHLALTHFVPGADPALTPALWEAAARETWQGRLTLGRDGMRIEV
ncbi:MBL fold metallo-hydrolase [Roseovarius sp. C7]|uniref:MBL fold metallo-hydrolase n=1 Tax=Roseovarius sp. C7 TaxID=3398643 RepID=UPI0039F6F6A0